MLAHIAGVPVEESLLYLAPVILLVAWMYYAGWRERRSGPRRDEQEEERPPPPHRDRPGLDIDLRPDAGEAKVPQDD